MVPKINAFLLYSAMHGIAQFITNSGILFFVQVQFDQSGLFVGQDDATWLKAGVEFAEGSVWLSVVVTRSDYSDWSKSSIPWQVGKDVYVRVYRCCNLSL